MTIIVVINAQEHTTVTDGVPVVAVTPDMMKNTVQRKTATIMTIAYG